MECCRETCRVLLDWLGLITCVALSLRNSGSPSGDSCELGTRELSLALLWPSQTVLPVMPRVSCQCLGRWWLLSVVQHQSLLFPVGHMCWQTLMAPILAVGMTASLLNTLLVVVHTNGTWGSPSSVIQSIPCKCCFTVAVAPCLLLSSGKRICFQIIHVLERLRRSVF